MFDRKIFPRDEQKWKVCVYEMKGGLRVDFITHYVLSLPSLQNSPKVKGSSLLIVKDEEARFSELPFPFERYIFTLR